MKVALDAFELTPYLMAQPLGYRVPDGGSFGWVEIPEFPFSVEPRQITRWEARKWARQAFELGVRYIGGCCGFEPYHIRAMAEELADVRGGLPEASSKSDHDLAIHRSLEEKGLKRYKNKGSLDYWMTHQPATVRPRCHTSRSPQLIMAKVFGQLRHQDCFYDYLLSFVRRSLPAWRGVVLYWAVLNQC